MSQVLNSHWVYKVGFYESYDFSNALHIATRKRYLMCNATLLAGQQSVVYFTDKYRLSSTPERVTQQLQSS